MLGSGQTRSKHESENIIADAKSVIAEFNWNSAYDPYDYGSYITSSSGGDPVNWYTYSQYRTNLIWTPNAATTPAGVHSAISSSGTGMSYGSGDSAGLGFTTYYQIQSTAPSSIDSTGWGIDLQTSSKMPINADKDYACSAYFKTNSAVGYSVSLQVETYVGSTLKSTHTVKTQTITSASGWTRVYGVLSKDLIDKDETYATVKLLIPKNRSDSTLNVSGDYFRFTGFVFEQAQSVLPYFDGTNGIAGTEANWAGTTDRSTSTLTFQRDRDDETGDPIQYDRIVEYIDDSDVTTYQAETTHKNNRSFSLYDCFMPDRPNAGIVHMRSSVGPLAGNKNTLFQKNSKTKFYPVNQKGKFKYWNSFYYRKLKGSGTFTPRGSTDSAGLLTDTAPYIVYNELYSPTTETDLYADIYSSGVDKRPRHLVVNSIRVKVQTYEATHRERGLKSFAIDVLPPNSDTWTEVFTTTSFTTDKSGVIQIWKNPSTGTWGTTEQDPSDLSLFDINNWDTSNAFSLIRGVRVRARSMHVAGTNKAGLPLELIEIAPLTTLDITSKVKAIRVDKGFNSTEFGMPFGTLNPDQGSVVIQNIDSIPDDINFISNESILGGMARRGFIVKSMFKVTNSDGIDTIPLKKMYCQGTSSGSTLETTLNLTDRLTYLQDIQAPNLFVQNKSLSYILSMIFDNIGWKDYDFSNLEANSSQNQKFKYFYATPDNTVQDAIENVCRSAGATIYEDEYGIIRVKSRQDLFGSGIDPSFVVTDKTLEEYPLDPNEKNFKYSAANATEISTKSSFFDSNLYGASAGGAVSVGPMYGPSTAPMTFKNQNGLIIKRNSGPTADHVTLGSGTSTSVANKVVGVYHSGRQITLTVSAKTNSGTANAKVGVIFYDKNKHYLSQAFGTATAISTNAYTGVTYSTYSSNVNAAYFGIALRAQDFSSNGIEAQFTDISVNAEVLSNVLSYSITDIDPISAGTVKYSPRGIFKVDKNLDNQAKLDSQRTLTDLSEQIWLPGQRSLPTPQQAIETTDEAVLGSSILLKPLGINSGLLKGISLATAKTEDEARAIVDANTNSWLTLEGQSSNTIVNYQGYLMINGEIIRYDGREFVSVVNGVSTKSTIRSPQEYQDIRTNADQNVKIYPTGRVRIFTRIDRDENGIWYVSETGRAQFGTTEFSHDPDIDTNKWIAKACIPGLSAYQPTYKPSITTQQKSIFGEQTYFGNMVVSSSRASGGGAGNSDSVIGPVVRDMGAVMSRWGSRVRISGGKNTGGTAGIIVGSYVGPTTGVSGFLFQIKTTESAGTANNIAFYELQSDSTKNMLWSTQYPIYPNSLNSTDNTIDETSDTANQKGIYDLEVAREVRTNGVWVFTVYINGKALRQITFHTRGYDYAHKTSLPGFHSSAGVFVGNKTIASFENFWAVTGNTDSFKGQENSPISIDYGISDLKKFGELSGALDTEFLKSNKYKIFYEEFGCIARECKYFNAKFSKYPVTSVNVISNYKANDRYAITNLKTGSFGAEFLVINLSKGTIDIGSSNDKLQTPLAVYGVALNDMGERTIYMQDLAHSSATQDLEKKIKSSMRRSGRPISVDVTGNFICSLDQATELAEFYLDKLSDDSHVIEADVFGNPCYQLGDVVFAKLTEQTVNSMQRYVITGVSHQFDTGLSTSIVLRRVGEW